LASRRAGVRAGFIHIPYLPAQAARLHGVPSMAQAQVEHALELALRTATITQVDCKLTGGTIA
jgi:pyroglutamyl-peptidase